MLDSMWKVASNRSWFSGNFIKFGVVSFSVTEQGKNFLESHPSNPTVLFSIPCPTVSSCFGRNESRRILALCSKYDPDKHKDKWSSLGYGGQGILIAYAHGAPNNSPNILHKGSKRWMPLFPKRTTIDVLSEMKTGEFEIDGKATLERMGQARIAASEWLHRMDLDALSLLLIMSSLRRPPRTESAISSRTGIKIPDVERLLQIAIYYGWVTGSHRLTDDGLCQIVYFKKSKKEPVTMEPLTNFYYYPRSLKAPVSSI